MISGTPKKQVFVAKSNKGRKETVDLHMHSTLSDGAKTVEELLHLAKHNKLNALAITDHDNLDSFEGGHELALDLGLELVPGLEISAVHQGKDVHILGYLFDHTNLALNMEMLEQSKRRHARGKAILKKLKHLGIDLSWEKVLSFSKGGVLGRPHIAMALQAEEYVGSFSEAFNRYLGDGAEAFVEKKGLSVEKAIRLIQSSGGIAVMAHPLRTDVDDLIPSMADWGLGGIETFCHSQKGAAGRRYREIAKKYDLVCSGGSDFHNDTGSCKLGGLKIPLHVLGSLKDRLEHQKAQWL